MNFVGITFPDQKVTPSDDAMVMNAILSDGILHGCGFDYAGFALTMAAGHMVISGRNIQHPAAETVAIDGAASGYARLVLTIDLSKTATIEVFDQIDVAIEYASDPDSFLSLDQSEINVSGIRYQVELCVVSLSSGGITGIVRQLPRVCLRADADFLMKLFAAGRTVLSPKQIVTELPDAAGLADYTVVGLIMGEV